MKTDLALQLKIDLQKGKTIAIDPARQQLSESILFKQLLSDFDLKMMPLLWRLTQLSGVPFSHHHTTVKKWLQLLVDLTNTNSGFTYSGIENDLLPCYNAMITSLLIKMQYPDRSKISTGIDWIMKHQPFGRNITKTWHGTTCKKYGGCLKPTPCYIGVVKSVIALSDFKKAFGSTPAINEKLSIGLEYILDHRLYLRKSKDLPITKDILVLTYPFTWRTNVIELLKLMKDNQLLNDPRNEEARKFLLKRRKKDGFWHTRSVTIMKKPYWVKFDEPGKPGLWITNEIERLI